MSLATTNNFTLNIAQYEIHLSTNWDHLKSVDGSKPGRGQFKTVIHTLTDSVKSSKSLSDVEACFVARLNTLVKNGQLHVKGQLPQGQPYIRGIVAEHAKNVFTEFSRTVCKTKATATSSSVTQSSSPLTPDDEAMLLTLENCCDCPRKALELGKYISERQKTTNHKVTHHCEAQLINELQSKGKLTKDQINKMSAPELFVKLKELNLVN